MFNMAQFRSYMEQDPRFKNFDLDAFQREHDAFMKEHGEALEELSAQAPRFAAQRSRWIHQGDPEALKREILARELQHHGIDWQRFFAGKRDEHEAVDAHLKQCRLPFTAADLLSGNAWTMHDQTSSNNPESVTVQEAETIAQYRGGDVKNFVYQRANTYQQIKAAAGSNSTFDTLSAMMNGGVLAFGEDGASAAQHALRSGATIAHAIYVGVAAIGGVAEILTIVSAVFVLLWAIVLIFSEASVTIAFLNRTASALAIGDIYIEHGQTPTYPHGVTVQYPKDQIMASPEVNFDPSLPTAVFLGYYYQKGNIGFVGVNAAVQLRLLGLNGAANDLGGQNMYIGYAIEKFGGVYQLAGINSDASAKTFYQRHFTAGYTSATSSNGQISVASAMNDYSSDISAKQIYQLTVIQQQGQ